ncbi:MAG: hypothetical protein SXQ77_05225, partial [Halobacteria archaeon]|nr:hypothetical protein [Halobacteria archaeon]
EMTVTEAVRAAPRNTTVLVKSGRYLVTNLTIEKPLTLRGKSGGDVLLEGEGNGSVIEVNAPRVAVSNLGITGVGDEVSVESIPKSERGEWDYRVKMGYGYGDSGVELDSSNGSLVTNVRIDTPSNGVLFRDSYGAVVNGIRVNGTEEWNDGFMGVMVMESRVVVQNSSFYGGRDAVYTHEADGL